VKFKLKEQLVKTTMIVSNKLNSKTNKIEIGRKDLKNFIIRFDEDMHMLKLSELVPLNLASEKAKFFAANYKYNPQLFSATNCKK
jgi:hypothetical protein